MQSKLRTATGKALYAVRKQIVEPVFGMIKSARGIRKFLLRGLEKVSAEWQLICLTHNLLKIWRRSCSVGVTHRAALGGPLTARELFFRRIGLPPWLVFILLYFTAARVSGPIYSGAYCPWVSMAREAWSLSLVTCHAGFSRRGIDPVGETANVNEPPLGSRRLVVSSLACASW